MKISPTLALCLNLLAGLATLVITKVLDRPSWMSDGLYHDMPIYSVAVLFLVNGVLHGYSAPCAGPFVGRAVSAAKVPCLALLGVFLTMLALHPAPAAADVIHNRRAFRAARVKAVGLSLPSITQIANKIAAASIDDMRAALNDAQGNGDVLSAACYPAVIKMVQTMQASMNTPNLPKLHPILAFQQARDIRNALEPGSPIDEACGALARQVKADVLTLVGAIIGGTVSYATFLPAL